MLNELINYFDLFGLLCFGFWVLSVHLSKCSLVVSRTSLGITWIMFLPEASFGLQVLSLPASVCVCLSVCVAVNPELVRAINHHAFKREPPNLDKRCKTTWLRPLLFWGAVTLTFMVKFNLKSQICPILSLPSP